MERRIGMGLTFLLVIGAVACAPPEERPAEEGDAPVEAQAFLHDSQGEQVGSVTFAAADGEGVQIRGWVALPELADGPRGFHVHESGACDDPEFEGAGDHYEPGNAPHGGPDDPPAQRHAGDLGNLEFDAEGRVEIEMDDPQLDLEELVGRSVVVHQGEDDLQTDPDGDAGDRMACGVIQR